MSLPIEGMLGVSAGRATGRLPPSGVDALEAAGLDAARAAGFLLAVLRALVLVLRFAVARFAGAFFLPPEREAVLRFAVVRLAVDFLPPDRFAVDRLAVDFFVDFFFAAICPPFGCAM
jgi:hypothetical protein